MLITIMFKILNCQKDETKYVLADQSVFPFQALFYHSLSASALTTVESSESAISQ